MATVQTLPKDVSRLGQEVKLFGKWDTQECVFNTTPCTDMPIDCFSLQRRGERYFPDRLHSNPARRLSPPYCRPICQETVQEGSNAHSRTACRQVGQDIPVTWTRLMNILSV